MTQNYQRIGNYISVVDNRNADGRITLLMGISIDKCYIQSVANTIGTDLHNYKVIKKRQFACSLMQVSRDQKIPLALYLSDEPAIMSPAYVLFEVNQTDCLLPEYLDLWFKRSEFDREASFYAVGGVRGSLDWEDFCNMKLPVPSIDEQRRIVHNYNVIQARVSLLRKINDSLEAQAQAIFDHLFMSDDEPDCTLADIALVNPSRQLSKGTVAKCFEMATLPIKGCIPEGEVLKPYNGGTRFINGDTLIARITPCLENGKAAYINILETDEVAFGSTEFIVFASKCGVPSSFYYFLIRNSRFVAFALQFMNGSSGRQRVSGEELASFTLKRPSGDNLNSFDAIASKTLLQMRENVREIKVLQKLSSTLIATLSNH